MQHHIAATFQSATYVSERGRLGLMVQGCLQVLTALVQEQATQGIDHGFSDTMVGLLSHYHDRAWCRPILEQCRPCRPGHAVFPRSLDLSDLPDNALAIILQQLEPGDLLQLDTATMGQVPFIRQRLLQMRYAGRWLQLTCRMPGVGRTSRINDFNAYTESQSCNAESCAMESDFQAEVGKSPVEEEEDEHSHQSQPPCLHDYDERLWGQLQQMSKHSLLQKLLQQICHINDVAALIDEWVPAHNLLWAHEMAQLGIKMGFPREFLSRASCRIWLPQPIRRMRQLQHKVVSALSIGFVGFLDFAGDKTNPDNKAAHHEFASFGTRRVAAGRCQHNQLLFLCSLHRLQQLPPEAVLARLHGIFSRCCRVDLLLLVTLLASTRPTVHGALWPGARADDILTALGGMTTSRDSHCTTAMARSCQGDEVNSNIKQHIRNMVDEWVGMASVWNDLGRLLSSPIFSASRFNSW